MSKEVPLQIDMFSGELVDTRTRKQKKNEQPVQAEMFSQREMAQFGVRARPLIPLSPKTRIELALQDMRSEEEKVAAQQKEIEKRSYRLPGFEQDVDEIAVNDSIHGQEDGE